MRVAFRYVGGAVLNYDATSFFGFLDYYVSILTQLLLVSFLERLGLGVLSSGSSAMVALM